MKIHQHKRCDAKPKAHGMSIRLVLGGKTREKRTQWSESAQQINRTAPRSINLSLFFICCFLLGSLIASNTHFLCAEETVQSQSSEKKELKLGSNSTLAIDHLSDATGEFKKNAEVSVPLTSESQTQESEGKKSDTTNPQAITLLRKVLEQLVHGPAFHCKVRETVWTNEREVVGVGTYEQAGQGTGRYHLQVTMHDGKGRHRLQQISDGRLAWTRTEIASDITLRRVDVGRLDEWLGRSTSNSLIAPRYTVGAWVELLTSIHRDYNLDLVGATLDSEPVWVIKGDISSRRRAEIMKRGDGTTWPMLCPTRVHVAVGSKPNESANAGQLLPLRFEFWSDPGSDDFRAITGTDNPSTAETGSRLITLIELYSIQAIISPPVERFRFENREAEVNFINETDRYIQMHGIQLTERERLQLRR